METDRVSYSQIYSNVQSQHQLMYNDCKFLNVWQKHGMSNSLDLLEEQ